MIGSAMSSFPPSLPPSLPPYHYLLAQFVIDEVYARRDAL